MRILRPTMNPSSSAQRTSRQRSSALLMLLSLLTLLLPVAAGQDTQYVRIVDDDGDSVMVPDNRQPSLYTQDFGVCGSNSLINVTRFDAAWYKDNMTILFHLEGNTNVANDSLMSMFPLLEWSLQLMVL